MHSGRDKGDANGAKVRLGLVTLGGGKRVSKPGLCANSTEGVVESFLPYYDSRIKAEYSTECLYRADTRVSRRWAATGH